MPDFGHLPMIMRKNTVRGFTMLEVLISMVIIAFGLLGIAGLQAFALKNNQSASLRLTATTLASDIIDRMKTNVAGVSSGAYNQAAAAAYAESNLVTACATSRCDPPQLAQHDLAEWAQRVAQALPGGQGVVCIDSTPADGTAPGTAQCDGLGIVGYAIKIWWSDDRTTKNPQQTRQLFWTAFNP
jgi:type IV pilus assembly protein PilV